jgi:hypothetical protein
MTHVEGRIGVRNNFAWLEVMLLVVEIKFLLGNTQAHVTLFVPST